MLSLEDMREAFRLEGEEIIRRSRNTVVGQYPDGRGYCRVSHVDSSGRRHSLKYHRLKFALAHGTLPCSVDHRDRDPKNNLLSNLRAGDRQMQAHNQSRRKTRTVDLPRGVYTVKGTIKNPYKVVVTINNSNKYLGVYPTMEAASEVAEAFYKEHYGDNYSKP